MTNNAASIAKALDPQMCRPSGTGYVCRCPTHDDDQPSLKISEGEGGKILVHCHADCDQLVVIDEIKRRGLWPEQQRAQTQRKPRQRAANDNKLKQVAKYEYFDHETGELKMQVLRYEPKTFRQRRPDPSRHGEWTWSVGPEHRTLYNAMRVSQHDGTIFVVEGEKDVDNLGEIGVVATCNPGGAGKWEDSYCEILRDKDIVLVPDNDDAGRKHTQIVGKALQGIVKRVRILHLPDLPEKGDISDWLAVEGNDRVMLEKLVDTSELISLSLKNGIGSVEVTDLLLQESASVSFKAGSEVEVAEVVHLILRRHLGDIVYAEGELWFYADTQWTVLSKTDLWRGIQHFDRAVIEGSRANVLKLGRTKIESILHELQVMCAVPDFFENPAMGINCASGFITFDANGKPSQLRHAPEHRARHTLPGRWVDGAFDRVPPDSNLSRLLNGCFAGDDDAPQKIDLLAEVAGVAALGYATASREPKAVVLYGMTAENGKSQILDLMRGLLPSSAVSAITAAKMSDEKYIVGLAGKLLNATDELSGAAIASDTFKTIITGEQVNGRDVYKSSIEFRPRAQHLFATNILPPYKGGMDRGVQRRLLVVPFNRTVPKSERIEHIGQRIGAEEPNLLLAWAIAGASRVICNRAFSEPLSCKQALREWVCKADAVQAWIEVAIEAAPGHCTAVSVAYEAFCNWAVSEGYTRDRLPHVSAFSERVQSTVPGVTTKRTASKRFLRGFVIKSLF